MNRTVFSLPEHSEYRTRGGLVVSRAVEQFTGNARRLDDLIDLLDRRRGVVLSSGTTVPGRYESFDLGFSDPPLQLETAGSDFSLAALNPRGEVLIAFLGDALREPCVVVTEKNPTHLKGHILRGAAPVDEDSLEWEIPAASSRDRESDSPDSQPEDEDDQRPGASDHEPSTEELRGGHADDQQQAPGQGRLSF